MPMSLSRLRPALMNDNLVSRWCTWRAPWAPFTRSTSRSPLPLGRCCPLPLHQHRLVGGGGGGSQPLIVYTYHSSWMDVFQGQNLGPFRKCLDPCWAILEGCKCFCSWNTLHRACLGARQLASIVGTERPILDGRGGFFADTTFSLKTRT